VLSLVKPCDPCWEIYHASKIKITYTPYIYAAPTLGVRKNMFSIYPKMFYSYTGYRHKNIFVRINAPSSCKCLSWKVSIAEKEAWAMQELFIKEKRSWEKMDKCPRYWKQWVLKCPPEKKERKKERKMNKIAHDFLQKCFKFQSRETFFKEHSRIRIATIYIHSHAHLDLRVWYFSPWILILTL
jgi:hypothetical protein